VAPEARPEGSDNDPIDCSVNIIRKAVFWPELENTINDLDGCLQGLPSSANKTCGVALALIKNEISDLQDEMALKKAANAARKSLQKASAQARIALDSKSNEEAAIKVLSGNLSSAENISGHYLTEDIHIARDYLDRLGPIPAVRQELEEALVDARMAQNKKEVVALNDAIVRLNISVVDAREYKLREPLPEAQQMLNDLLLMRARLVEFQTIVFDANVSLGTRSKMPETIVALKYALDQANISNFTKGVAGATTLLGRLKETNDALKDLKWATHHGQILLDGNKKGKDNLEEALRWLNTSFTFAQTLRVSNDETTMHAAEVLDKLQYVYGARVALQKAIAVGQEVLHKNGSVLADDSEEVAIDLLEPAIAWGEDVGIQGGLSAAEMLMEQLMAVEQSKENMTRALLNGNGSLAAKTGEAVAIRMLNSAIAAEKLLEVDAGIPAAEAELELLKARKLAKDNLNVAVSAARRCLRTRKGTAEAVQLLNSSVTETNRTGLVVESHLAYEQMMRLLQQQEAMKNLTEALHKAAPVAKVNRTKMNDTEPEIVFNRSGFEVTHLPYVNNSKDDGDANFDEHIRALDVAIAAAKALGVIDPDMEMRFEHIEGMKSDYFTLQQAIRAGNASWISKDGVQDSIELLTAGISEALGEGLVLGVATAKQLLGLLVQIQPAMDEYEAALAQGNISLNTVSHMGEAILRLDAAVDTHKKLRLKTEIPLSVGREMIAKLDRVKKAYVTLKASIVAGQVSLDREEGEEAAMAELNAAIQEASAVNLQRELPVAVDLLHELVHMNAEHQKMAAGMSPSTL